MERLETAIVRHRSGRRVPPQEMHDRVKEMYRWEDVAARTEKASVYNLVVELFICVSSVGLQQSGQREAQELHRESLSVRLLRERELMGSIWISFIKMW